MAQASGKKKNSSVKKSSSKNKSTSRKKNKQISMYEIIFKREFSATVTFVAGLLLLIISLFPGADGSVWNSIYSMYFAVFGICGYYIPLAVLFFGVVCVLNKHQKIHFIKAAEIFVLFILVCSLFHVNAFADVSVGYFDL
ncbi:MAG: hypothetical protein IKL47_12315 [Clostridia bacterium]|nr:hypothetical protein [Clostridia bacterium]